LRALASELPEPIDLEPGRDLYGPILFHQGRFQRIRTYRHLRSKTCIAEITPAGDTQLYAQYLPDTLVLGDFTARDAVIHAIQACIPHGTLLPVGVEHITFTSHCAQAPYPRFVYAKERARVGALFTYDVEVRTEQHEIIERWEGLRLQLVAEIKPQEHWKYTLLVPFLERRVNELCRAGPIGVAFQNGKYNGEYHSKYKERHVQSEQALRSILGSSVPIYRLADGRPVVVAEDETRISVAHTHDLTLGVAASQAVGCDMETVLSPSSWQDLLGPQRYQLARLVAAEYHEELDVAATRTWTALESLKKAGAPVTIPLILMTPMTPKASNDEGWVCFSAGQFCIMTYITHIQQIEGPLSLAICIQQTEQ
jgi:enediyne polyketide synthase